MDRARLFFQRLLHPPRGMLAFLPPLSFAALIALFSARSTGSAPAYLIYGMSAYSLAIWPGGPTGADKTGPICYDEQQDPAKSRRLPLCRAVSHRPGLSRPCGHLSGYGGQFPLCGLPRRCRSPALERRCYRTTARLLFLLNLPMTGMTVLMARTNSGFSYPGSILYLSALYTFYAVAVSIVDLVKFRRLGNPILFAAKVLNLISAMMSVLGLQTAMISRFSENGECYRQIMNAITGGVVYGMVLILAAVMLRRSSQFQAEVVVIEQIGK